MVQDATSQEERLSTDESFRLPYQLLVQFSQTLGTAKRAVNALHSAVSPSHGLGSRLKYDYSNPCAAIFGNGEVLQELPNANSLDSCNFPPANANGPLEEECGLQDRLKIPLFYVDTVLSEGFHFQESILDGSGLDSNFWFQFYNSFGTTDSEPPSNLFG